MKIFKLTLVTMALALFNNANASLVILSSYETGSSVSSVSSSFISGSGTSSGYCGISCSEYQSYFEVKFDIIGSQLITINASLNSSGTGYGFGSEIMLSEPNSAIHLLAISEVQSSSNQQYATDYAAGGSQNPLNIVDRQFLLSEGSYRFVASAFADSFNGSGEADYSFTVTTVPVPAAVWLFGSGLLGLIGIARRKKA